MNKLVTELDSKKCQTALEILKSDTSLFQGWTKPELIKLSEYLKVITYQKNVTILTRFEIPDYLGIVITGRLRVQEKTKNIGYLSVGDLVGYMGLVDLPGAKVNQFEIVGDTDGFIGIIPMIDLTKIIFKRDATIGFKIIETAAKKALNIVHLQYKGEEMYTPITIKTSNSTQKKVKDALESCPELVEFLSRFDAREKKNFLKYCEYVDFESEQKIVKQGTRVDFIIFLMKGELISFKNGKPNVIHKPGAIIGRREFLFRLSWEENIFGKLKGSFVKIERDQLSEMLAAAPVSAATFVRAVTYFECKNIKETSENKEFFKTETQEQIPETDFLEFDVSKKYIAKEEDVNHKISLNSTQGFEEFMIKKQSLPLYMHEIHKSLITAEDKPEKTKKEGPGGMTLFMQEKLKRQAEENQKKKLEAKRQRKVGGGAATTGPRSARSARSTAAKTTAAAKTDGGQQGMIPSATDQDYEELRNEYGQLESENMELKDKLKEMGIENKALRDEIKRLNQIIDVANVKINKNLLHRELLSKDLAGAGDSLAILNRNYNVRFPSFGEVLTEQFKFSKRNQKVAKFAYKWLFAVRAKNKKKLLASKKANESSQMKSLLPLGATMTDTVNSPMMGSMQESKIVSPQATGSQFMSPNRTVVQSRKESIGQPVPLAKFETQTQTSGLNNLVQTAKMSTVDTMKH